MKKIICFFVLAVTLIGSFFCLQLLKSQEIDDLCYVNKTELVLTVDQSMAQEEIATKTKLILQKYDLHLAKYIWHDDKHLVIYGSDSSLHGRVKLRRGDFLSNESKEFLSSVDTGEISQKGVIQLLDQDFLLEVRPLSELSQVGGLVGICVLDTLDMTKIRRFCHEFTQELGTCEILARHESVKLRNLVTLIVKHFFTELLFVCLCFLLFVILLAYYLLRQAKKLGILQMLGFSSLALLKYMQGELGRIFLPAFILAIAGILSYLHKLGLIIYFQNFLLLALLIQLGLYVCSCMILLIYISWQKYFYKLPDIIKGKRPLSLLLGLSLGLKVLVLLYLAFCLNFNQNQTKGLKNERSANAVWEQAKQIYRIKATFITSDSKEKRPYEIRAKKLFAELENEHGMFMFFAKNWGEQDTIEHAKRKGEFPLAAKSIIVNRNYLLRHEVKTLSKQAITEALKTDSLTLNVLVPLKYKVDEAKLRHELIDDFYFKKVSVANIYHEMFNEPLEKLKQEDLRLNLIYVADGAKYFTYDAYIAQETGNEVLDPVIIVDNGNFDASFYYAYLTSSCYFASQNRVAPITDLLPSIESHDMTMSYRSAEAIYDQRGATLAKLDIKIRYLQMLVMVLISLLFLADAMFTNCYFAKNCYAICVKRLHGFSFLAIHQRYLLWNIFLTVIILLSIPINLGIKSLVLGSEIILFVLYGQILQRKLLQRVIKEGK